jgi:hypothetical protein
LFPNHCLRLRLLGLPRNGNISQCFANCTGMLLVSHGSLELRQGQARTKVAEGGCIELPLQEDAELWAGDATDVLFFERARG